MKQLTKNYCNNKFSILKFNNGVLCYTFGLKGKHQIKLSNYLYLTGDPLLLASNFFSLPNALKSTRLVFINNIMLNYAKSGYSLTPLLFKIGVNFISPEHSSMFRAETAYPKSKAKYYRNFFFKLDQLSLQLPHTILTPHSMLLSPLFTLIFIKKIISNLRLILRK